MLTVGGRKETLVDYSLVPDLAIVDPVLTSSMPPTLTADTGIDALTHALEAVISIFASSYTDALCAQAVRLIFDALPRAYEDPGDLSARTDMSNAATLAGLAFSNAFVGTNHALAHAVGGARFGIAHGRANGIFLPHVMRYNSSLPSKFMPAPGYSAYVVPEKYAQLGQLVFGGHEPEDSRERLFRAVEELLDRLDMPRSLKEYGVPEDEFLAALPELAMTAFEDLSNRTNPPACRWWTRSRPCCGWATTALDVAVEEHSVTAKWDPCLTRRVVDLSRLVVKTYFRSQVTGLENIPSGPSLVVSNHSGGLVTFDLSVIAVDYYKNVRIRPAALRARARQLLPRAGGRLLRAHRRHPRDPP